MAISDMAAKGYDKLSRKRDIMARNWENARSKMLEGYRAVGFGPTVTSNYEAGIHAATYRAPDPDKWRRNWERAMSY